MSGRIGLLATVLAVQLLVVAGVVLRDTAGSSDKVTSLLAFTVGEVDRLVVSGEGETVTLQKSGDGWRLENGAPADANKIDDVLGKLAAMSAPWPVATTGDSRTRFEVTEDSHQRHLQAFAGDESLFDLYLGTSPGYRRVHARIAGSDDVYSIDFATYEVPVAAGDWLDKELLQPSGTVSAIAREGSWSLTRDDEGWLLAGVAPAATAGEGQAADADAAKRIAERIADLRVIGFAEPGFPGEEKGVLAVRDEAGSYRLIVLHDAEEDQYAVRSSRVEGLFEVAGYIVEQLLVDMDDLRPEPAEVSNGAAQSPETADSLH